MECAGDLCDIAKQCTFWDGLLQSKTTNRSPLVVQQLTVMNGYGIHEAMIRKRSIRKSLTSYASMDEHKKVDVV